MELNPQKDNGILQIHSIVFPVRFFKQWIHFCNSPLRLVGKMLLLVVYSILDFLRGLFRGLSALCIIITSAGAQTTKKMMRERNEKGKRILWVFGICVAYAARIRFDGF